LDFSPLRAGGALSRAGSGARSRHLEFSNCQQTPPNYKQENKSSNQKEKKRKEKKILSGS
jgi:hypothetical protein